MDKDRTVRKELVDLGVDLVRGLRIGIGFPGRSGIANPELRRVPRLRPSCEKLKESRLTFGEFYNVGF